MSRRYGVKRKPERESVSVTPRWLPFAIVALTGLYLIGLFSTELADPDAWWHLRTGEYIATRHQLPDPDPFAWTTASAPLAYPGEAVTRRFNLTHEWLSQLLLFGIYSVSGFAGVVLWKAFLLTAVCGLAGWVAARRTQSWWRGVLAALATAALATVFTSDRPALLTFFFVALFIAIFERGGPLSLLPALALVWANCHGGFFLAWVICAAYSIAAFPSPEARNVWAASAAVFIVSGINPNGFRVVETLLLYRQSFLTSTLIEWSRPYLWGPPYAFDILLYGAAIVLALAWRRVRISDWILFGLFTTAALLAFRNMLLIGFLAPILIATYFPWKPRWNPYIGVIAQFSLVAILAVATVWGLTRGVFFQYRAALWRYPAGAVRFLIDNRIAAPLFNTYEYGGFLIFSAWPSQRVFIDGRALSESVYQDYRKILTAPPRDAARNMTLARYHIGAIVMNGFEYTSGVVYPLAMSLGPEWSLVYEDPQSLVFLRDVPPGMPVIDRRRVSSHLDSECDLHIERDPEFPLCARTLGDLYLRGGDRARARRALNLYLEHSEGDPEARRAYQQLLTER